MVKPAPDSLPHQQGIKYYFLIQNRTFNAVGIDPTSLEVTIFNKFLVWLSLISLVGFCFPITMYATQYIQDMELLTDALAPLWQILQSTLKLLCFLWNKKKIVQLIRKLMLWNLEARDEEFKIVVEENRKDSTYVIGFYVCVAISAVVALMSPFVIAFIYYLQGYGFMDYLDLPFRGAYQYVADPKTYFGYSLAYIWNVFGIFVIVHVTIANDSLFSWFAHNISSKFRILNLRFKSTAQSVRSLNDDELFNKSIKVCIDYHRQVIDLVDNFNEVYMLTIFIKFTMSLLQIACLVYTIARGGEFSTWLFHILFLVSVSIQLMLYCHGGQRIINESASVTETINEYFRWQELSVKSKKLLLLPLMRAQKPCIITGVFFVVDLRLFLWVFKTSGSFITLLMAMDSK